MDAPIPRGMREGWQIVLTDTFRRSVFGGTTAWLHCAHPLMQDGQHPLWILW
jgi:hypothetical protein